MTTAANGAGTSGQITTVFLMGLAANLYNVWDTIWYIYKNGWTEYKEARRRYDTHTRLQSYGDARFNKKQYIKMVNLSRKRKD